MTDEDVSVVADLKKSISELEFHLSNLRSEFGSKLYTMQYPDGKYIAEPILIALVNGKAALLNRGAL
jgi:hypothetical protein